MKKQLNLFLIALTFFTRIPLTRYVDYSESALNQAARYFSWVGWVVGCLVALVYLVALQCFSPLIAVLLSLTCSVLLTGAFHEDGFADCCDGFGGGWEAEHVLRIMKDSRLGTYGVIGISLLLSLKVSALFSMTQVEAVLALCVGHVFSRSLASSLLYDMAYVSDSGNSKSKPLATRMDDTGLLVSLAACVPLLLVFSLNEAVILVGLLVLLRMAAKNYFTRRIGGYTGDCLGALQQVAEVLIYLVFVAL